MPSPIETLDSLPDALPGIKADTELTETRTSPAKRAHVLKYRALIASNVSSNAQHSALRGFGDARDADRAARTRRCCGRDRLRWFSPRWTFEPDVDLCPWSAVLNLARRCLPRCRRDRSSRLNTRSRDHSRWPSGLRPPSDPHQGSRPASHRLRPPRRGSRSRTRSDAQPADSGLPVVRSTHLA